MIISSIPEMMSTTRFDHPLDQNPAFNDTSIDNRNHNSSPWESVLERRRSTSSGEAAAMSAMLYSLSLLKNKVNEVQSLLSILISPIPELPDHHDHHLSTVTTVVQEIIVTASSMMFNCQQMMTAPTTTTSSVTAAAAAVTTTTNNNPSPPPTSIFSETLDWYSTNQQAEPATAPPPVPLILAHHQRNNNSKQSSTTLNTNSDDIIELDVAEILAKYTHYCQICGKGFKRDANLRMHMRAHGDEYKTASALKATDLVDGSSLNRSEMTKKKKKYSCPQEGCRWNQKHVKFQPLKSMICAKNHYKRSHCPKMYVCKRCNRKQFSVLSDLRTHEKHCGHSKWQCSCGTTFSRKDKLMGHVGLFVGHTPMLLNRAKEAAHKIEQLGVSLVGSD